MTLHSLYMQRPAKIITVLVAAAFVWIWLTSVQNGSLSAGLIPGGATTTTDEATTSAIPDTDSKRPDTPSAVDVSSDIDFNTTPAAGGRKSKIAKISVSTNKLNSPVIDRAFISHQRHNDLHGHAHFIAKHQAVSDMIEHDRQHRAAGAWTKPAYILSVLVAELEKPVDERLEWVFWFDADTLIMNPYTPLEVFMPPTDAEGLKNVDLLIASNWDGLNSGVFALRVAPWSVSFMSAVLAYPIYETARQAKDRFRDQSAFQFLLTDKESPLADMPMKGHDHWVEVPMRWFNSLPVNNAFYKNGTWVFGKEMPPALFDKGTSEVADDGHDGKVQPWKIMQGDLCVHFAGSSFVRDSWMEPWVKRAERELPEWANPDTRRTLATEVAEFWDKTNKQMVVDLAKSKIEEEEKKKERERLEKEKKDKEEQAKKEKAEAERKAKEEKAIEQRQKKLDKYKVKDDKLKAKLEAEAKAKKEKEAKEAGQQQNADNPTV